MQYIMQLDVDTFRTAWFLESVLSEMLIVFSLRTYLPFFKNMPSKLLVISSLGACVVSFAAIYLTPVAVFFHLVPISLGLLAFITAVLLAYFATTELGKVIFFRYIHKVEN
jgi:Mg2+-importing ATPase